MKLLFMYWQRALRKPGTIVPWIALPFVFMLKYGRRHGRDRVIHRIQITTVG